MANEACTPHLPYKNELRCGRPCDEDYLIIKNSFDTQHNQNEFSVEATTRQTRRLKIDIQSKSHCLNLITGGSHNSRLLIFSDSLLEEICLPLQRDELHPIK